MATPYKHEQVTVRHRAGAGYAFPQFGVAFLDAPTCVMDREAAQALCAAAPQLFAIEPDRKET